MPTWTTTAQHIARNATHLAEDDALRLLAMSNGDAADCLASRHDLTDTTVAALIDTFARNDGWGLRTLAGNKHLSQTAQRMVVTHILNAGRNMDADNRSWSLTAAAKVIADPDAIAAIVKKATSGHVPVHAWKEGSHVDGRVPAAMCEHAVADLVERGDVDDALTAADFMPLVIQRLPAEARIRGGLESSPLRQALHGYGMRHLDAYEAAMTATGDLRLLVGLTSLHQLQPATVAAINRAVQDAITTAAETGKKLNHDAEEALWCGWERHIDDTTKTQLRAALDADTLDTGRRDWFRTQLAKQDKELRGRDPYAQPEKDRWATLPPQQLRAELDKAAWQLDTDELRTLWSRTDLPDGLSVELLRCGNSAFFDWALPLRPWDRELAIRLYTTAPGHIPDDLPLPELAQVVTGIVRARGTQYAHHLVKEEYYARLGELRFSLPADVTLTLSRADHELATHAADALVAALRGPGAALLPSMVEGLGPDQPLTAAATALNAVTAA